MVDNYHQLHKFIIIIEAEHLIEVADTQVTKVIRHTRIIADSRAVHIVTIDCTVIIDFIATIDLGTDMTIITATDRKAIIEIKNYNNNNHNYSNNRNRSNSYHRNNNYNRSNYNNRSN